MQPREVIIMATATFTVRIDYGHHEYREFHIRDMAARTRSERAASLCRLTGGVRYEVTAS